MLQGFRFALDAFKSTGLTLLVKAIFRQVLIFNRKHCTFCRTDLTELQNKKLQGLPMASSPVLGIRRVRLQMHAII